MSDLFELQSVACARAGRVALRDATLRCASGEFIAVCGLNGAGKSTLLEVMAGLLRGYSGTCRFEGREVREWNRRALARRISFLPQTSVTASRFSCAEIVAMGRYPFGDHEASTAVRTRAMQLAGCVHLEERFLDELSGGERQRVLFAAVLAQEPAALLLDEPGTFIDLPHQVQMFRTLRDLCREGLLCVAATHDLNLALAFATRLVLLDDGRIAAAGPPDELAAAGNFQQVFGEAVQIVRDGRGGVRVHYAV